jgi:hypothetical protein
VQTLRNLYDHAGAELGLPDDIDIECRQASAGAATRGRTSVDIHECRKEPSIETDTDVPGRQQLDASPTAGHEPPLVICGHTKTSQSNEAGNKRPDAPRTQLLNRSPEPMINGDVPLQSFADKVGGDEVSVLMGKETFEVKSVRQRHIERKADGRSAVGVYRSPRNQLEEVPAEAVADKWRSFYSLRVGWCHTQRNDREPG